MKHHLKTKNGITVALCKSNFNEVLIDLKDKIEAKIRIVKESDGRSFLRIRLSKERDY